jgi:hypothetical protein
MVNEKVKTAASVVAVFPLQAASFKLQAKITSAQCLSYCLSLWLVA